MEADQANKVLQTGKNQRNAKLITRRGSVIANRLLNLAGTQADTA